MEEDNTTTTTITTKEEEPTSVPEGSAQVEAGDDEKSSESSEVAEGVDDSESPGDAKSKEDDEAQQIVEEKPSNIQVEEKKEEAAQGSSTEDEKSDDQSTKKRKLKDKKTEEPPMKKTETSPTAGSHGIAGFWNDERKLFLVKETCLQKPYIDKNIWSNISKSLSENICFQGVDPAALTAKEVQSTFRQLMIEFEKVRERGLVSAASNSVKKALYDFLERTRSDMLQLLQAGQNQNGPGAGANNNNTNNATPVRETANNTIPPAMSSSSQSFLNNLNPAMLSNFTKEDLEMLQRQYMPQGGPSVDTDAMQQLFLQQQQQQQQQQNQFQAQQKQSQQFPRNQMQELQQKQMLLVQQHMKNVQNANNMNDQLSALQNFQNVNQQLEQRFQNINSASNGSNMQGSNVGDSSASALDLSGNSVGGLNPVILQQIMAAASTRTSNPQQQQILAQQLIKQMQQVQQQQQMMSSVGSAGDNRSIDIQRQNMMNQVMREKDSQVDITKQQLDNMQKESQLHKDSRKPLEPQEIQQRFNELGENLGVESDLKAESLVMLLMKYIEKKKVELEELIYLQTHPNLLELAILREQNSKLTLALDLQKLQGTNQ